MKTKSVFLSLAILCVHLAPAQATKWARQSGGVGKPKAMQFIDLKGKEICPGDDGIIAENDNVITLDLSRINPGTYVIRMNDGSNISTHKFQKP
jgi:hypothetical protein